MSDPAWFPSAAMQTIGAMYAIFAAVYVLALRNEDVREKGGNILIIAFAGLSISVFFSILVNAVKLYALSFGLYGWPWQFLTPTPKSCFYSFVVTMVTIIAYSVLMVQIIFWTKSKR